MFYLFEGPLLRQRQLLKKFKSLLLLQVLKVLDLVDKVFIGELETLSSPFGFARLRTHTLIQTHAIFSNDSCFTEFCDAIPQVLIGVDTDLPT